MLLTNIYETFLRHRVQVLYLLGLAVNTLVVNVATATEFVCSFKCYLYLLNLCLVTPSAQTTCFHPTPSCSVCSIFDLLFTLSFSSFYSMFLWLPIFSVHCSQSLVVGLA